MSTRFTDGSGLSMTNVHCQSSAPKTKRMRPYEPFYGTRPIPGDPIIAMASRGRGVLDHRSGKFHARNYTDIELGSLARWLNDRAEGYPDES